MADTEPRAGTIRCGRYLLAADPANAERLVIDRNGISMVADCEDLDDLWDNLCIAGRNFPASIPVPS